MSAVGYVVKSMKISIKRGSTAAVEYECAITGVTEQPTADTQTVRTACPDGSITDVGPASWAVSIDYLVSNLPGSLHRILREHEGESATLSIEPFPVQEPGVLVEYDVTLTPAGAGYVVGQFGAASATVPVVGKPRTVDPVAPGAVAHDEPVEPA